MSLRPSPWPVMTAGAVKRAAAEVNPQKRSQRQSPKLRVLEGGVEPRIARLSPRARLITLVAMMGVVLFGVVAFHVALSQGQFKLESLNAKASKQQDQYQRLRLQVSQLESPARITSEAQNRLGMVTPDKVTPVTPNTDDVAAGASATGPTGVSGSSNSAETGNDPGDWAKVKSQLSSSAQ